MKIVVMLEASSRRFVDGVIEDKTRLAERAWLLRAVRTGVVRGIEFDGYIATARPEIIKFRRRRERVAFARAVDAGQPVYCLDHERALGHWRTITVVANHRGEDVRVSLGNIVDWLLGLAESQPMLLPRLDRIGLHAATLHAHRWHQRIENQNRARNRAPEPFAVPYRIVYDEFHRIRPAGMADLYMVAPVRRPGGAQGSLAEIEEPRTSVFMKCEDNLAWHVLLNPAALDAESACMHHCVGYGSYDHAVISGSTWILSLRAGEKSLCTVQWMPTTRMLAQVKGPANGVVEHCAHEPLALLVARLNPLQASNGDLARNGVQLVHKDGRAGLEPYVAQTRAVYVGERDGWHGGFEGTGIVDFHIGLAQGQTMFDAMAALRSGLVETRTLHYVGDVMDRLPSRRVVNRTQEGGRHGRARHVRTLDWSEFEHRPCIDRLRSIASNPDLGPGDRQRASQRLHDLLTPATQVDHHMARTDI